MVFPTGHGFESSKELGFFKTRLHHSEGVLKQNILKRPLMRHSSNLNYSTRSFLLTRWSN